jgi:hypothetical protein
MVNGCEARRKSRGRAAGSPPAAAAKAAGRRLSG